ncbi:MAG: hypothetical protein U0X20_03235 [Caldilineaceae bacterium]
MAKTKYSHVATQVQARQHLQMGITRMADALAPTLGPFAYPVVVEGNVRNKVELIDDAATVARRIISLGDPPCLDIGAMIVRNVVWRVSGAPAVAAPPPPSSSMPFCRAACARSPAPIPMRTRCAASAWG